MNDNDYFEGDDERREEFAEFYAGAVSNWMEMITNASWLSVKRLLATNPDRMDARMEGIALMVMILDTMREDVSQVNQPRLELGFYANAVRYLAQELIANDPDFKAIVESVKAEIESEIRRNDTEQRWRDEADNN